MNRSDTIANKVIRARKARGLTQPQLQNLVPSANIWRIENGKLNPGAAVLEQIAKALDMDLDFVEK
jgi:transcriptional regulator with XRE-family HTH domain